MTTPAFTFGVEEEFHVVDPATGQLAPEAERLLALLPAGTQHFTSEIMQSMVETATDVCSDLAALRAQLVDRRRQLTRAAQERGLWVVASGSPPLADQRPRITRSRRYMEMAAQFAQVAREQVVCGCHAHVGIPDRGTALAVANRLRHWMPTLLAMMANSPFWNGIGTGYSSYRTVVWSRWPSATPFPGFPDEAAYDALVEDLIAVGAIRDRGQIYWDLRLSAAHPTLEFRTADVATDIDDAVLYAALCRALARTAHREHEAGAAPLEIPTELMIAARWSAARFGLDGELVDLVHRRTVPARQMVAALLDHVDEALEQDGCRDVVRDGAERLLARGTGARRQRDLYVECGDLMELVRDLAARTRAGG